MPAASAAAMVHSLDENSVPALEEPVATLLHETPPSDDLYTSFVSVSVLDRTPAMTYILSDESMVNPKASRLSKDDVCVTSLHVTPLSIDFHTSFSR